LYALRLQPFESLANLVDDLGSRQSDEITLRAQFNL